ncbi:MAG: membrane protein insertase YidC [Bacteroidales bacterium]|nr:membrane protein insertase YidC [Bacteroidales bacterium]MBQ4013509.1 membrane protein insertase YidC [Bacteroidales bacterium]
MNEKRSSVVGFALIGIIMLVFTWYNTKQVEKRQQEAMVRDSLATAAALERGELQEPAAAAADTAAVDAEAIPDEEAYRHAYLQEASRAETDYFTLENDKLRVRISSLGAQPYEVQVKDYYTYDSSDLILIRPDKSLFDLEMNTDQWLNTSDLHFRLVESTDSTLTLRLQFEDNAWMDAVYSLASDSYMLGYQLHFVGMDQVLDRRTGQLNLKWVVDVPRLEKGYQNERNYSGVAYKYMANNEVKSLGKRRDSSEESFNSTLRWVGFQQQFFSAILVAENGFPAGKLVNQFYPENQEDGSLMQSGANLSVALDTRSSDFTVPFQFYFGPNHFYTLKGYDEGFEKIIPLGGRVIGTISRYVIIPTFNWLSKFIRSYGLIILLLTIMIKLVISPLTWQSYTSSAKMRVLKPEIDKINEKYPRQEDAMKKQQATMDLYRRAGVSMWGGCLPILLQFPILWAMFRFFPASIELRQQGFLWCHDLSAYDSILDFGFKIPLYGDHISLFALLMGVSMWGYSKMTMSQQPSTQTMPGMEFMQVWLMPIMMIFICNNLSAGLSYYYLLSNIITIGQNWAIRKWFVDEDKIYAKLQKKANSKEPPKKSKFQQRLEAAYKAQQEQQKQQYKKR